MLKSGSNARARVALFHVVDGLSKMDRDIFSKAGTPTLAVLAALALATPALSQTNTAIPDKAYGPVWTGFYVGAAFGGGALVNKVNTGGGGTTAFADDGQLTCSLVEVTSAGRPRIESIANRGAWPSTQSTSGTARVTRSSSGTLSWIVLGASDSDSAKRGMGTTDSMRTIPITACTSGTTTA